MLISLGDGVILYLTGIKLMRVRCGQRVTQVKFKTVGGRKNVRVFGGTTGRSWLTR